MTNKLLNEELQANQDKAIENVIWISIASWTIIQK